MLLPMTSTDGLEDSDRRGLQRHKVRVRGARMARVVVPVLLVGLGAGLSGCAKPLLSPREPRSQYSRYDLVRNQYAPQYLEDEFGRRIPNLRGRLLEQQ